jgi:serine/threonine-protein kinase
MSLVPGLTLSGYRIARKLGAGAFGAVWLAERVEGGEKVAIKTLLKQNVPASAHFDHVSRFKREAMNLRRIDSEYVARCIDFIVDDEHGMLIVMEYIEGELLSDILQDTPLSLPEAVELGVHLARGLCDMHKVGVIHRDLKPSNIMIRQLENGLQRAVIFDLGLSRLTAQPTFGGDGPANGDITATASRVAIGTPAFMAPEQMLDARRATPPSDVYGVGVVLYYASSGMLPFEGDEREIARRKLSEEAPPLDIGRHDELALRFSDVVGRAIRRRPDDRYRTADDFLASLVELRQLAAEMDSRRTASTASMAPGAPLRRPTPQPFVPYGAAPPPPPMRARQATMPDTRARTQSVKSNGGNTGAIVLVLTILVVLAAGGGLWAAGVFTSHGP